MNINKCVPLAKFLRVPLYAIHLLVIHQMLKFKPSSKITVVVNITFIVLEELLICTMFKAYSVIYTLQVHSYIEIDH